MEKKYISYEFPSSLSGWREKWFYIRNRAPSLLERTTGALKITHEWSKPCVDESQIPDLLSMIKKVERCGCHWRSGDVLMCRQADPATTETVKVWLRVPWSLRPFSILCRPRSEI
jgi:hypothetical protein